jgi:hypothetical protein
MADKEDLWRNPILTRENYETWFRRYMVELRGKGVYYVIEKKLHEHAEVATVGDLTDALEEFKIADSGTATTLRINIDKKAAYLNFSRMKQLRSDSCSRPLASMTKLSTMSAPQPSPSGLISRRSA